MSAVAVAPVVRSSETSRPGSRCFRLSPPVALTMLSSRAQARILQMVVAYQHLIGCVGFAREIALRLRNSGSGKR